MLPAATAGTAIFSREGLASLHCRCGFGMAVFFAVSAFDARFRLGWLLCLRNSSWAVLQTSARDHAPKVPNPFEKQEVRSLDAS